jgi:tRNA A-37 threonylcarbamoyl transferase component Bud32
MKEYRGEVLRARYDEHRIDVTVFERMQSLLRDVPRIFSPLKGGIEEIQEIYRRIPYDSYRWLDTGDAGEYLSAQGIKLARQPLLYIDGFFLIPTVKKTSLFYHIESDHFVKILHPLSLKDRIVSALVDRGYHLYNLSRRLNRINIGVPDIMAYGYITRGRRVFFIMDRIKGESLYPVMVGDRTMPLDIYYNVIDKVIRLHREGYWFGDFRLSHVFVHEGEVTGIVDIDSIKKNFPFRINNLAKDIAGFNHPRLPLSSTQRQDIFSYYIEQMDIKRKDRFYSLLRHYTRRRWDRS